MTTIDPRQHDEAEAALCFELAKAERTLGYRAEQVHFDAGDKRDYRHRSHPWCMTFQAALAATRPLARSEYQVAKNEVERLGREIDAMEAVYREHNWTRYFPCQNSDGHIHSSLRGCSTVYPATPMGWHPSLSGKTVEEAVTELGPTLCSVCFPSAPAEWRQKKSDIERASREAAKAARLEAQYDKKLRPGERFRDGRTSNRTGQGEWVETVAAAKQVLREVMEFKHYSGPNHHHPWYETTLAAAGHARAVLLAREARKPGTGATQEQIDQILARAEHKQLAYFR